MNTMVNTLLKILSSHLDLDDSLGVTEYMRIPPHFLQIYELILKKDYHRLEGVPLDFPYHSWEEKGWRTLLNPLKGDYNSLNQEYEKVPIIAGSTKLHVKNFEEGDSIEGVIIFHDNIPDIIEDEDFEETLLEQEMGSVLLLEHGFILLLYKQKEDRVPHNMRLNINIGKDGYSLIPDIDILEREINDNLSSKIKDYEMDSPNIKALPQLAMLAAHVYQDYEMQKRVEGNVINPSRSLLN